MKKKTRLQVSSLALLKTQRTFGLKFWGANCSESIALLNLVFTKQLFLIQNI